MPLGPFGVGSKTPPYMDVSENSGTPKSSILIGFSLINHPFWGTPIFGSIHIRPVHCTSVFFPTLSCHVQYFLHGVQMMKLQYESTFVHLFHRPALYGTHLQDIPYLYLVHHKRMAFRDGYTSKRSLKFLMIAWTWTAPVPPVKARINEWRWIPQATEDESWIRPVTPTCSAFARRIRWNGWRPTCRSYVKLTFSPLII